MDTLNTLAVLITTLGAALAVTSSLFYSSKRDRDRRSRIALEQIRLRETELKYESAIDAQAKHAIIDQIWKGLRTLDRIEDDDAVQGSQTLRGSLRDLRNIQYTQLELLLSSFDEDRGEQDLGRLNSLLRERRTELDTLPEAGA